MTVTAAPLAEIAARLKSARVMCVGDLMLDRFVDGSVDRISPEAPIPVLRIRSERAMLGGAGNVVRNMTALGAACGFLSVIGEDRAGAEVMTLLSAETKVDNFIGVQPERCTSVKTRFFAASQQLLRADEETIEPLSAYDRQRLLDDAKAYVGKAQAMVLSDYGKGVLGDGVAAELITLARAQGIPVIVDPKGRDFERYRGASMVTPNRRELAEATGMPVETDAEVVAAARHVIAAHGIDFVLATRSQDGMSLIGGPNDEIHHLPAEAREVFDVSGAGDTVVATVAAALAVGAALPDAARLANLAAGIVVGRVGTAAVPVNDLISAVHHQDVTTSESKLVALDQAVEQVEKWRRQGLRVGFTNGCFDLLHPGHVSLLRQSRTACDRLVVALNSDSSVGRLKGPTRPIQPEMARATVLASVAGVDLVVIFHDDTPLGLIKALRPDVLVKGADYTVETVVGADVVQSYGGRVMLARLEDGFSTTSTIARMERSA